MNHESDAGLVSIVVPVYNESSYVEQCLNSIANQTYENIEIIIIDDGSTDRSGEICEVFARLEPRALVIRSINRGLSAARNMGVDYSTGDYILFVDADDWLEEDAIRLLLVIAKQYEADLTCGGTVVEWAASSTFFKDSNPASIRVLSGEDALVELACGVGVGSPSWGKLIAQHLAKQVRFPEGRLFEDIATTHQYVSNAAIVVSTTSVVYHYRMKRGSIAHSHDADNLMDCWFANRARFDKLANLSSSVREHLLGCCISAIGRLLGWWMTVPAYERKHNSEVLKQVASFSRNHLFEILVGRNNTSTKIVCVLACWPNLIVMVFLGVACRMREFFRRRNMYL